MVLFGIAGSFIGMAFSYFNGTITTLEKRYKIPTKTSGIISVGNDISTTLTCAFLGYYAGRGHRPRYIALGRPQKYIIRKARILDTLDNVITIDDIS